MNQHKSWNIRRLLVCGVLLALIPAVLLAARGRRILIDGQNTWQPDGDLALDLSGDQNSTVFVLPMPIKIGSQTYDSVWISENGYVVLTQGVVVPSFPPLGASSLAGIPGNIIAPFYADVESRAPQADCFEAPRFGCGADVAVATLDLQPDPEEENPPEELRGFRVTWGFFESVDDPLSYPAGVLVKESASEPASKRSSFQLRLIDRSDLPNGLPGDFDLELNYDGIPWENVGIIGIKAGGVLLDFAALKTPFFGLVPPSNVPDSPCALDPEPADDSAPHFDKNVLFTCNAITVSFRDGRPNLRTYTADLRATIDAPTDLRANAGDPFSFDLNIDSLDPRNEYVTATNVTSTVDLPAGFTFVSATPGTLCDQTGSKLRCNHGSLAAGGSLSPVTLRLRANVDGGPLTPSVHVSADQFDPVSTNDDPTFEVTIDPTADLALTSCTAPPAAVTVGTTASITCSVKNEGPQSATGVSLTAQLPASVTFASGTGCGVSGTTLTCNAASIAAGATTQFSVTLNTVTPGSAGITASVTSAQHDPTLPNSRNVTITITEDRRETGGGGGGGGATSLLTLLLLGLLPRRRRQSSRGSTQNVGTVCHQSRQSES
jgi:uncharacterized repeat protein (TIGR01451 family)